MSKMVNKIIRGIRTRKLWAVFSPDGYLQYRSISDTKKGAKKSVIECHELANNITWKDYAENGWVVNKILVDIKII